MTTKPQTKEEILKGTRFYKEGGSCFECCDYGEMVQTFRKEFDELGIKPQKGSMPNLERELIVDYWRKALTQHEKAVRREAWIDGFMATGEGYNGEYCGMYGGNDVNRDRIAELYDTEHALSQEE